MEQSEVISLFRNGKFVEDARSIASETSCPGTTFPTTTRKIFSFHLLSSLMNETPKPESFQIKVVEDIKLSFDSYRILVSE